MLRPTVTVLRDLVSPQTEGAVEKAQAISDMRDSLEKSGLKFGFGKDVTISGKTFDVKAVLGKFGFRFSKNPPDLDTQRERRRLLRVVRRARQGGPTASPRFYNRRSCHL